MKFIADLHIHSYLARACSKRLVPEVIHEWCQLKGVGLVATGDFTHPRWFAELNEKLSPAEPGLFKLEDALSESADRRVPASCRAPVRFVLGVEISSIYKKGGRVRKVHNLVYLPSFESAERFNSALAKVGNIASDGRPILGLDSKILLEMALEADPAAVLIPAHAWTPHFGVLGSESGFGSLEECFEELAPMIFAIETGLSSDPPMNWRLSALDRLALVSNSDAHSPEKLAREANVLDCELSYSGLFDALRRRGPGRLLKTLEFFPEEGKYHLDGHRACGARLTPRQTRKVKGLCPKCRKPVTVGVLSRVEKLSDREAPRRPAGAADFESLVPLKEILAQILRTGAGSKKVDAAYMRLLSAFGGELRILREVPVGEIERAAGLFDGQGAALLALAISRMRKGQARLDAGYDGLYGTVSLLNERDFKAGGRRRGAEQLSLL